jgi:hypothetical protein
LLTSLRQWCAQIRGHLNMLVGHIVTPGQRLQMHHEDYGTVQLPEFENDSYVAWLTICVKRSIEIPSLGDGELDWGPGIEQIVNQSCGGPWGQTRGFSATAFPRSRVLRVVLGLSGTGRGRSAWVSYLSPQGF